MNEIVSKASDIRRDDGTKSAKTEEPPGAYSKDSPEKCVRVPLELLDDSPFQERKSMAEPALRELAESILEHGLLQPISVCRVGNRFEILAGHRRATAYRRLLEEAKTEEVRKRFVGIPAIERCVTSDQDKLVLGLVENLQRADLNPLEEASGVAKLIALGLSPKEVAARLAKKEERVRRLQRLHDSPAVVKEAVSKGLLVAAVEDEVGSGSGENAKQVPEHRRRMDLMPALQFAKLHRHLVSKVPRQADERTQNAIERALRAGWSEKRIKLYVDRMIEGRQEDEPAESGSPAGTAKRVFSASDRALLVRLDRLPQLAPKERGELAAVLKKVLTSLETTSAG